MHDTYFTKEPKQYLTCLMMWFCVILLIVHIMGCGNLNKFTYSLRFEEPKPLNMSERVVMNGVSIGSIGKITKNDDGSQTVQLLINRQYAGMIRQKSTYRVFPEQNPEQQSNRNCIVISVSDPASPPVKENSEILVERTPWENLLQKGQEKIDRLFGNADRELEILREQMKKELNSEKIDEFIEEMLLFSEKLSDRTEKNLKELRKQWKEIQQEFQDLILESFHDENMKKWKEQLTRQFDKLKEKADSAHVLEE